MADTAVVDEDEVLDQYRGYDIIVSESEKPRENLNGTYSCTTVLAGKPQFFQQHPAPSRATIWWDAKSNSWKLTSNFDEYGTSGWVWSQQYTADEYDDMLPPEGSWCADHAVAKGVHDLTAPYPTVQLDTLPAKSAAKLV
eukprot:m.119253 g.119253  ORF g.119253 m.119253 type:complete len:140 (+) comp16463_c0_seq5:508-927(+)